MFVMLLFSSVGRVRPRPRVSRFVVKSKILPILAFERKSARSSFGHWCPWASFRYLFLSICSTYSPPIRSSAARSVVKFGVFGVA